MVEEQSLAPDERVVANVGKTDAKKHLAKDVSSLMAANIIQVCIAVGGLGSTWWSLLWAWSGEMQGSCMCRHGSVD